MGDILDDVDKFIIDISSKLEDFIDDIDWDYLNEKFDLNDFWGYYDEFYEDFFRYDSTERIINNAISINPEKCIKMLEYICYKYSIDFNFSFIKDEIMLHNKESNIEFPKKDSKNLNVFISYSNNDIDEANRIYAIFKKNDIHCFLASEEIKLGENWDDRIFEELIKSDMFIFLVSENYKNSFWCNQEASIGYLKRECSDAFVIPLLIDNVNPYGIFYKIQGISSNLINDIDDFARFIDNNAVSFDNAVKLNYENKLKEMDEVIDELKNVNSFDESNDIFNKIVFHGLELYQIEKIFDYSLLNNQIWGSWEFHSFVKKCFRKYDDKIDLKKYDKIYKLFEEIK